MITYTNDGYRLNGENQILFSGEFPYFRVPERDWRTRFRLWREAGGNTVATYLPWLLHEPAEGKFRLEPIRRFLDMVAEEKLFLIARPGPYQYSELLNAGLPEWLIEKYPQILARNRQGKVINRSAVSYLHPVFLEKTERYFEQVCPLLAEYTVSRGGPIAMTQVDNELFGIQVWFGDYDFNAETAGFGREDGNYAAYLRRRFGSVEAVNARYGTKKESQGAFSPSDEPASEPAHYLWNRDYFDFYTGQGAEYLERLVKMMRKFGIDTPFCHNSGGPAMNSWFLDAKERPGDDLVIGSDHYFNLTQDWAQNNPTPQYFVNVFLSLETLRLMGNPPSVWEFPFGSCSDWPPFTPEDFAACLDLHTALGMKGFNGYIYTGGPNAPGTGVTTDLYDYNAPVGAAGEVRPTYDVLKRYGKFLEENRELYAAEGIADFQICLPWDAARAGSQSRGTPGLPGTISPAELWNFLRRGIVTSSFAAGLLPRLTTLEKADSDSVLVLPSSGAMSAADQRKAVDFLKRGGRLLCLPVIPRYDMDYRPCTILSDFVGAVSGEILSPHTCQTRITMGKLANVFCNGGFVPTTILPDQAEVLGRDECSGRPAIWKTACGDGMFAFLGMSWNYTNSEQHRLWERLLETLGVTRFLENDDPWTFAVPRGGNLFVCNLSTATRRPGIRLRESGDFRRFELPPMTVAKISIEAGEFRK